MIIRMIIRSLLNKNKKEREFNYGSKTKLRNGKWRETVSNL